MNNRQMSTFAVIGFALVTLLNSVFTVDTRERVLLKQFGQIVRTDFEPGLHFKLPFMQNVMTFDGRVLTLDNQTENFLTLEKKNVKVDFFVKWKIADTATYYLATGGVESVAMDRLASNINRGLRDQFASRTIQQALSSARGEITRALQPTVKELVTALGITIVDVRVKRIDFPDDVREKVYERMRAERTRVASELRAKGAEEAEKIRATADQKATVTIATAYGEAERTRGEGDAKAAEIYARVYGQDPEFYRFYRSLQAYRDAMRGKQDVMVLEPDSEFFRYFKGAGGGAPK
ncbi:MAG TPA: protease modulator HflC [Verrucomicrobiae bacterium]|nr:protease modulator HflC [Verrucomicrobiae bacterium]